MKEGQLASKAELIQKDLPTHKKEFFESSFYKFYLDEKEHQHGDWAEIEEKRELGEGLDTVCLKVIPRQGRKITLRIRDIESTDLIMPMHEPFGNLIGDDTFPPSNPLFENTYKKNKKIENGKESVFIRAIYSADEIGEASNTKSLGTVEDIYQFRKIRKNHNYLASYLDLSKTSPEHIKTLRKLLKPEEQRILMGMLGESFSLYRVLEKIYKLHCWIKFIEVLYTTGLDGTTDINDLLNTYKTSGSSPLDCKTISTLSVALCRASGIPARRIQGYVRNLSDSGKKEEGHAWTEVFIPKMNGWVPLDNGSNSFLSYSKNYLHKMQLWIYPVRGRKVTVEYKDR